MLRTVKHSMKMSLNKIAALAAVFFMCLAVCPARADDPNDILVVVNKTVSSPEVSLEDVRNLFLLHRTTLGSNERAIVLNAKSGSTLREDFRRRVLDMSAEEELRFWQERKVRSGQGAPAEFSNPLKAVFKIKHAVGYVYRHQYKEGVVKVVKVIPADKGPS